MERLRQEQERRLKPLGVALGLGPELGLQQESLDFEPALALEAPLLLRLLVELEKQLELVLALELQLVELLRNEQERELNPLEFALGLGQELGLQRESLEL